VCTASITLAGGGGVKWAAEGGKCFGAARCPPAPCKQHSLSRIPCSRDVEAVAPLCEYTYGKADERR
jgi:hypothetical protein